MSEPTYEQISNYRLIRLLGSGGFAKVYLGEHIYLKTLAAIKILRANMSEGNFEAFLNEARTLATLDHPHIIRILEFGKENETPYLVMAYAPNGTLRKLYPRQTKAQLPDVVRYVKQIAAGLQYAHDLNVVHRDIKLGNILLGRNYEALLSDFGLAVMAQNVHEEQEEDLIGTALYMAPEQFQGKTTPASDQYSLGVIVYELLCGAPPFTGADSEIVAQHLQVPPPPLREYVPDLPASVEQVVLKALAKDPQERYPQIQQFAQALEQASVEPGQQPALVSDGPHTGSMRQYNTRTVPIGFPTPVAGSGEHIAVPYKQPLTRRAMLAAGGLLGIAALCGGVSWYMYDVVSHVINPFGNAYAASPKVNAQSAVTSPVNQDTHPNKLTSANTPTVSAATPTATPTPSPSPSPSPTPSPTPTPPSPALKVRIPPRLVSLHSTGCSAVVVTNKPAIPVQLNVSYSTGGAQTLGPQTTNAVGGTMFTWQPSVTTVTMVTLQATGTDTNGQQVQSNVVQAPIVLQTGSEHRWRSKKKTE